MLYFAYGSMMDRERLTELCPEAKPVSAARIPHHAVAFTGHSSEWGGGTATIALKVGSNLWGALYEIDPGSSALLAGSHTADGYVWSWTAVETSDGAQVHAGLLVKIRDLEPTAPSPDYLAAMKEGYKQWGLDPEGVSQTLSSKE